MSERTENDYDFTLFILCFLSISPVNFFFGENSCWVFSLPFTQFYISFHYSFTCSNNPTQQSKVLESYDFPKNNRYKLSVNSAFRFSTKAVIPSFRSSCEIKEKEKFFLRESFIASPYKFSTLLFITMVTIEQTRLVSRETVVLRQVGYHKYYLHQKRW